MKFPNPRGNQLSPSSTATAKIKSDSFFRQFPPGKLVEVYIEEPLVLQFIKLRLVKPRPLVPKPCHHLCVNVRFHRIIACHGIPTQLFCASVYTLRAHVSIYVPISPYLLIPVTTFEAILSAKPLQIEVVLNAAIPDVAFERERSVVLEEIRRSEDNPRRRTYYRLMEAAFEHLPYRRPVLGPSEVIEHLKPQQMRDFHATWYRPQSITASVVGNLPVEQLIEIVAAGFAQAEAHCSEPIIFCPPDLPELSPEAAFTGIQRYEHIDNSLQQARLGILWRVPGMADLPQTYALDVLASILGQGRTARLVRDLREERGLGSGISVSNMTYIRQGLFYISAQLPVENLDTVEALILDHIRRLHTEPISEAEIQRVRTLVANRYIFGNETPSDRASLYGYYQSIIGDLAPALSYPDQIQTLNAQALQAAVQQYLAPDAYRVVVLKP
ncbi:insulinase family protein [Leptolyngbya sp. 7M]|nr:insulinase family protein [Leptolyngbya sp. 7M]